MPPLLRNSGVAFIPDRLLGSRDTCRSIVTESGYNIPASLLVFELGERSPPAFDFTNTPEPPVHGLKIDRKSFFVAIADGQLLTATISAFPKPLTLHVRVGSARTPPQR